MKEKERKSGNKETQEWKMEKDNGKIEKYEKIRKKDNYEKKFGKKRKERKEER